MNHAIQNYKYKNPTWLLYFLTVGEVNQVGTKQSIDLYVPRIRTDLGKKTNCNTITNLRASKNPQKNLNLFKRKLKEHYLNPN